MEVGCPEEVGLEVEAVEVGEGILDEEPLWPEDWVSFWLLDELELELDAVDDVLELDGDELEEEELELDEDELDEELLDEELLEDSDCWVVVVWQALRISAAVRISKLVSFFFIISVWSRSFLQACSAWWLQLEVPVFKVLSSACGYCLSRYKLPKRSLIAHHSASINVVAFFSSINAGPLIFWPVARASR
tara:strand:- start:251 stop:823 length:573 start_codon:yes stop_codon:yes gene_type:complete